MPYPINPRQSWQYLQIPNLLGGINLSKTSDSIDNNQTLQLNNVSTISGVVTADTGYVTFGDTVVGQPQLEYQFLRRSLLIETILITTNTVYKYNTTLLKWHLVRGTNTTTTTAGYAAGVTDIVVASATGFTTGALIAVVLDNGDKLQTTITVSGTTFTLADAVPVGRSIANGAVVDLAVVLAGQLDHQISAETIPGSDWMVFTNGVDIVKRYDGTDCVDVPNLPSSGNTICEAVALYNTALFLLSTTEGGTAHAQRIRRSNQTDPTDWTTGTAGYDELLDESDAIKSAHKLGPYLIVYRTNSIARGSFIGSGGINYSWDTMIPDEGVISTRSIIPVKNSHIFVGHNNVYEYFGDYALHPIGDNIYDHLLGIQGEMHPSYRQRVSLLYITSMNELWIAYPSTLSSDGNCDEILRHNTLNKEWYHRTLPNNIISSSLYKQTITTTWDDLVGDWLSQNWAWNSTVISPNIDVIHLCAASPNQVFEYNFTSALDNGEVISYTIETKDFTLPDSEFRFDMLEMKMRGTSVLIEYSTDLGLNWNTLDTVTNTTLSRVKVFKQFVTNSVRFKITGSSADFAISWLGISYKIENI